MIKKYTDKERKALGIFKMPEQVTAAPKTPQYTLAPKPRYPEYEPKNPKELNFE